MDTDLIAQRIAKLDSKAASARAELDTLRGEIAAALLEDGDTTDLRQRAAELAALVDAAPLARDRLETELAQAKAEREIEAAKDTTARVELYRAELGKLGETVRARAGELLRSVAEYQARAGIPPVALPATYRIPISAEAGAGLNRTRSTLAAMLTRPAADGAPADLAPAVAEDVEGASSGYARFASARLAAAEGRA